MRCAAIPLVVAGQQREVRISRRTEGQRRGNINSVILAVLNTLLRVLPLGGQTIGPDSIRVDRTTEIGTRFDVILAEGRVDLTKLVVLRSLADGVDDAAGLRDAKERRVCALQNLHPLHPIRLHATARKIDTTYRQSIEECALPSRIEPADQIVIISVV
ncbi:hypothetical protein D3C80_958280 [compost metagenome]